MNLSALARDHVNNFRDTSTTICQTEKSGRHYTGPKIYVYTMHHVKMIGRSSGQ